MAENSKIEWTDHTFNPWTGCTKVSPLGCDHCYAEGWSKRAGDKVGKWGPGAQRVRTSDANWKLPLRWNKAQFVQCDSCGWRGNKSGRAGCPVCGGTACIPARARVFCASLADVFDNEVPTAWREDLFALIEQTPNLDWLLLTKRIGNAWKMMADACGVSMASALLPLPNVWLGATVVDQKEADRDIPKLLRTPASLRFLSCEPLLAPLRLWKLSTYDFDESPEGAEVYPLRGIYAVADCDWPAPKLDWVIVGGLKDIENRDWFTQYRGPILIHAGKTMTKKSYDEVVDSLVMTIPEPVYRLIPPYEALDRGGVVGVSHIADCVGTSESPWFMGPWGFVMRNSRPLPFHPVNGQLKFFDVRLEGGLTHA
jgi:protein gp37